MNDHAMVQNGTGAAARCFIAVREVTSGAEVFFQAMAADRSVVGEGSSEREALAQCAARAQAEADALAVILEQHAKTAAGLAVKVWFTATTVESMTLPTTDQQKMVSQMLAAASDGGELAQQRRIALAVAERCRETMTQLEGGAQ